jgi:hypothetical protein
MACNVLHSRYRDTGLGLPLSRILNPESIDDTYKCWYNVALIG